VGRRRGTPVRRVRLGCDLIRASAGRKSRLTGCAYTRREAHQGGNPRIDVFNKTGDRADVAPRITDNLDEANYLSW